MVRRTTEQEVISKLAGKPVVLLEYGGTAKGHSRFQCTVDGCGCVWSTTTIAVASGRSGCPRCAGVERVTLGMLQNRLVNRNIEVLEYAGSVMKKSKFRCSVDGCGCEWEAPANTIVQNGAGCPRCAGRERVTLELLEQRLSGRGVSVVVYAGLTNARSRFKCDIDGCEWETSATSVMAGSGCPRCSGVERATEADARQQIEDRPIKLIEYGGTKGAKSKFECLAEGCGHVWETTFSGIKSGKGCPKCAGVLRLTLPEVKARLDGRGITILSYAGSTSGISRFKCDVDGHEWSATFGDMGQGKGCPLCGGRMKMTEDLARSRLIGRPIELVTYGGKSHSLSDFRCTVDGCGHEWAANTKSVVTSGGGCPKCAGKMPVGRDEAERRLIGRKVTLMEYEGKIRKPAKFKCTNDGCGHEWTALAYSVINAGQGCPVCSKSGYDSSKDGYVYAMRIITRHNEYLGFGITNNPKRRLKDHDKNISDVGATGELLFSYKMAGKAAQELEKHLKTSCEIADTGIPGFRTEATLYDDSLVEMVRGMAARLHDEYVQECEANQQEPCHS